MNQYSSGKALHTQLTVKVLWPFSFFSICYNRHMKNYLADIHFNFCFQHMFLTEILRWRSQTTPDHIVFTLLNSKVRIKGFNHIVPLYVIQAYCQVSGMKIGFVINFLLYSWYLLLVHLSWTFKLAFLISWCPASLCTYVCKLFTFDFFSRIASFPKGRWLWNSENILRKFKNLLLQKRWGNFDQTWHKTSLCEWNST